MKARIEEYERLRKETEELKGSLDKIFTKAFKYLKERFLYEIENEDKNNFDLFKFWNASEYDDFRVEGYSIVLHYYDRYYGYDYDDELPPIPISIIENEAELDKWFDNKVKEYEDAQEKHRLAVEQKKREEELAELKRLKEKYE